MNSSSTGDSGRNVDRQIETLLRKAESLRAQMALARWIRWSIVLALLIFIGVTATGFINLGRQLASEQSLNKMLEIAKEKVDQRAPHYQRDIQQMVERTAPVLTDALVAQYKADMPKLVQAANTESDAFAAEFSKGIEERLRNHYRELLVSHEDILQAEFPEVKDEALHAKLIENLTLTVDKLVERYYVTHLEDTIQQLLANWKEFPTAEPPQVGDPTLQDQLIGELGELAALRLSKTDLTESTTE